MTAFWRGLPGGGLVYGNRQGSVQMVWDLQKGWSWDGIFSAVHDDMISRGIVSEGIMSKQKSGEMCRRLSYGDSVRDYIYGDFIVDLVVFSSLFDAISNGTTIISLNRLSNKIHASGYHPLSIPVSRNGLGVRGLIILTMTNM